MGTINGCCCGTIVGFLAAVVLAAAAVFGIWCWSDPEAKRNSTEFIERKWQDIKGGGDAAVESLREKESLQENQ